MSYAVELRNLHKQFGAVHALAGLDLSIPTGSTFGLVGPNGAGKTTLFSIIAGYLKKTSGSVQVLGGEVSGEKLRGRLGVLPQDALWRKGLDVRTQLRLCARLQDMDRARADEETSRVLELTGMQDYAGTLPEKLSHGMAKRVAISQALIGDPELVMLDEPLAGLDPAQARRIRTLIQEQSGKRTFVISSHIMADIETLCSHVAVIKAGKIVAQPSMADMTKREAMAVFTLADSPDKTLAKPFEALSYVTGIEVRPVEKKVQISVDISQKDLDEAVAEFIKVLSEQNVSFVGLQKGTSLEDAFLKMT